MASFPEKHYLQTSGDMEVVDTAALRERPRSCSGVSSDLSVSSSQSGACPGRPLSTSSGGGNPSSRTLVKPRAWRILPRSRMSSSLETERAMEEDTSLEGDEEKKAGEEVGSSVDGDLVVMRRRRETGSQERVEEANGGGSSVDAVVRTKSESDITIQKVVISNGDAPRMAVFKSRAERFSLKDDKPTQQKPSPLSKSQTLPLSLPPQLLAAAAGYSGLSPSQNTTAAEKSSTLSSVPARPTHIIPAAGQASSDKPREVEVIESAPLPGARWSMAECRRRIPHDSSLSGTDSDDADVFLAAKSDRPASMVDSPSRSVTLNTQDSSARMSFSKPEDSAQALTLEKSPGVEQTVAEPQLTTPPKSSDRPQVPTKPARRSSLNANTTTTPARESSVSLPSSPARASGSTPGPPKPPRTTLDPSRRSSSSLGSPKTPMETVLFSMGFTVVDDDKNQPSSKPNHTGTTPDSQPRPIVLEFPKKTEEKAQAYETQDIASILDHTVQQGAESDDQNVVVGNGDSHSRLEGPVHPDIALKTDTEPIVHDIVAKKMTKIKGDKKAEEKAAKAKKKEQKAREKEMKAKEKELKAKEKEIKAKMKAAAKDEGHHDKSRVKLFPWKVEFSTSKDKGPAVEETAEAPAGRDDAGGEAEGRGVKAWGEQRATAHPRSVEPPPILLPEDLVPEAESLLPSDDAATSKRTAGDSRGGGDGASSKSPSDKSQDPSPSTPSPQKDDPCPQSPQDEHEQQQQQQQQEEQLQQQQGHQSPSSPSKTAEDLPQTSSPVHGPESQPSRPHPSPQLQRLEASSCSPPRSPRHHYTDDMSSSDPSSDMDSLSGSLRRKVRQERAPPSGLSVSESDGEATSPDSHGGQGRRPGPRRHTVGGAQIRDQMKEREDSDRKREAFYELLATRYPQYADKITGMSTHHPTTAAERNPRPRESQRRRTTVVTYNPQSSRLLDQDDAGTMSDVEPSAFQRGGVARASLPIVRSASSSLERPIGLVFLVFGEETKKSLLPNEITSLDTVRALFVRAFPDKLSMEFLDSPKRKIYILEAATNIFFQLEDLRDIQDRTVLKVHECDSEEPQRVKCLPESRGRVQQVPVSSRPVSRQGYAPDGAGHYDLAKPQSLPATQNYQELMHKERAQWEMEQEYIQAQQRRSRSRSQTPELAERPRSLSTGAPRNRYSHSPERLSTPERGAQPLNPIPENPRLLANGFRQAALNGSHYEVLPGSRLHAQHPPPGHPHSAPPGRVLSPPTVGQPIYESVYQAAGHGYHQPQSYVTHSMRAAMPQGPQRATGPTPLDMRRNDPGGRHSLAFAAMSNPIYESFPQRTQSYRAMPERDLMPPRPQSAAPPEVHRMERMEAQIASLAAWVHQVHASPTESARRGPGSSRSTSSGHSEGTDTYPGSSASKENGDGSISASPGLSDIPATYSLRQPTVSVEMRDKMNDMRCRLKEFRVELQGLKRMEQLNQETMKEAFTDALFRIKKLTGTSGKLDDPHGALQKLSCNLQAEAYRQDKAKVEQDLRGLEVRMEGLKDDILTRRCHINVSDIEGQALQLTHITKSLADLKARCPQVHEALKSGSTGETQDGHEQFLSEESSYIEAALKRCKALTNSLVTLKRIASAQDTPPSPGPSAAVETKSEDEEDTMAILENLRAMVPDLESRLHSQEAANSQPSRSETDARRLSASAEGTDSHKCEPPQVPAKPARLLSASEIKQMGALSGSVIPAVSSHTVTVTSQITDHNDNAIPTDRYSARSAFFSSMQSPPTSPPSLSESSRSSRKLPTMSRAGSVPSVPLSPPAISSSTSPSHGKLGSGVFYQAVSPTRTRSAFSSIPLPNKPPSDKEESSKVSDKGKKVPPPPPPRTSSAKLSYSSPNGGVAGGSGRRNSGDKSPDPRKKDSALTVFNPSSPTSPGAKPSTGQKSMNKFQKDIAAGIYANLNRPDLQQQNMAPDRVIGNLATPAPAAVVTNSQDPQEEGELSGSESTGSSTSLDSQQGVALMRANSAASGRGPKPNPPQRHSSLSSRGSLSEESGKTKTQMLQERVRRSQEAGGRRASGSGGSSQVNGVDSARNGHKT